MAEIEVILEEFEVQTQENKLSSRPFRHYKKKPRLRDECLA